jgi:hypothetical protein
MKHDAKGPKTRIIMDFTNPELEMFSRKGEFPISAIIVTSPLESEVVSQSVSKICRALNERIAEEDLTLVHDTSVEMLSGQVEEVDKDTILVSLSYPSAPARIMTFTLAEKQIVTLH